MSLFDDIYDTLAVPVLLEMAGTAVTVTPKGGSGVAATAILSAVSHEVEHTRRGRRNVYSREAVLSTDAALPVYAGYADPKPNGTVTIASEVWQIAAVASETDSTVRLSLKRHGAVQRSRQNFTEQT